MKGIIKDMEEISDSKEVYESRPHPAVKLCIYVIGIMLVVSCLWMYWGEIDMVVEGRGEIRTSGKMNIIRNEVEGRVLNCYLEEGKVVRAGDILYTLDSSKVELAMEETITLMDRETKHLNELMALKQKMKANQGNELLLDLRLDEQIQDSTIKYEENLQKLKMQKLELERYTVRAPNNGVINISEEINAGDVITSGMEVCRILPKESSGYKVEFFIPNSDIAGVKIGSQAKFRFDALPYTEYGELVGKIVNISADARRKSDDGESGYYVTAFLLDREVYSYKGEAVSLKPGMTCSAYVITEKKKILYYLLEKINLID